MKNSTSEISVNAEGIALKGEVVDDLRPIVKRGVATADSFLRLFNVAVALPLDYLSNNLERFRAKYADRFVEIPEDRRVQPAMRIGCAVLQNAAYSAEEPEIQDLFANLLASASDSKRVDLVHPGYATVIADLLPTEAKLLVAFAKAPRQDLEAVRQRFGDKETTNRAISNLVRLGLLNWRDENRDISELNKAQEISNVTRRSQIDEQLGNLMLEVDQLRNELIKQLKDQHLRRKLEVTAYGRNFVMAVSPDQVTGIFA